MKPEIAAGLVSFAVAVSVLFLDRIYERLVQNSDQQAKEITALSLVLQELEIAKNRSRRQMEYLKGVSVSWADAESDDSLEGCSQVNDAAALFHHLDFSVLSSVVNEKSIAKWRIEFLSSQHKSVVEYNERVSSCFAQAQESCGQRPQPSCIEELIDTSFGFGTGAEIVGAWLGVRPL